ncbi:hypothetical protein NM688_g2667 [Phlebia brevispora]|uniref:Uncharacterized protein n=1 Tax=Phlebia brevispora TaxID=194682 RepID=A0ACC1T818_9APHY|nr:hypothetical protein NM688_g2667 [Phlebia brevispora]
MLSAGEKLQSLDIVQARLAQQGWAFLNIRGNSYVDAIGKMIVLLFGNRELYSAPEIERPPTPLTVTTAAGAALNRQPIPFWFYSSILLAFFHMLLVCFNHRSRLKCSDTSTRDV